MVARLSQGYAMRSEVDQAQTLKTFSDLTNVTFANSGTAATTALDAASPFGATRLRVDCPVGNTYNEVQLHSGVSVPAFPDGRTVFFRLWIEDWQSVSQIMVFAGNSGYGRLVQNTWSVQNSNVNNRGLLTIPLNSHDTTANTFSWGSDALQNVKIRVFTRSGYAARFWVDEFGVAPRSRPKVLITFDDASKSWITYAKGELLSRDLKATFGVGTGQVGTNGSLYVTSAEVLSLQADGHQVCAHNVTNTAYAYTSASLSAYLAEYDAAVAWLASWGITGPFNYHPFVQGLHDEALTDALELRGVRVQRGVDCKTASGCRLNYPSCGSSPRDSAIPMRVGAHGPGLSLANANTNLTNLLKYGGTYVAMFHDIINGSPTGVEWALSDFQTWLDNVVAYRRQGILDVMTADDWVNGLTDPALVA